MSFDNTYGTTGNNGDIYKFTIKAQGGQPMKVNGVECFEFDFEIEGNLELDDFFEAVGDFKSFQKQANKSRHNRHRA